MAMQSPPPSSHLLPIKHDLTPIYLSSLAIGVIMAIAALAGLLYQRAIYPADELRRWFVVNDWLNLAVGLPILLGSLWLAHRGMLIGLLCWPGALFYVLYVYLAYVISAPFNVLFLLYLPLVALSAYTLIGLVANMDGDTVRQRISGVVPARTTGGILIGFAILIIVRQLALMITALLNQRSVTAQEIALWLDDFAVASPVLLVVGEQLWRRKALGYVGGAGLLLQYGVLALGLIPGMMVAAPIDVVGVVVVFIMAALSFGPFALFVRGAMLIDSAPP
jgi:hypothetical protein